MKRLSTILSLVILSAVVYWSFYDLKPSLSNKEIASETSFSLDNALVHLKEISKAPHYVGSENHKVVQNYIVEELKKLGLNPEIQTQTVVNKKWFAGTTVENIVAKIEGKERGKSLLLLSHYDSSPHSSLGASDAGSGVVTILEGLRAFLAKKQQPKNDIIVLISDAEELGLLGAQAFVEHHELAKDVGLVLNFEARGSGGPSYMLLETNGKNSTLISEFVKAKPNFPAANSLMYSIYKMLPNDTDLTVFRENGNINGFNFAFIGDHFDYHTAQDSFFRLDRETLLHQADYLMNTLPYFANSDLTDLNSEIDHVYVNFPFIKLLTYPNSWIIPMLILAQALFILLLFFGISLKTLTVKGLLKGFLPLLLSLVLCLGVTYLALELIYILHPHYKDILHGFPYNGYIYITAFVFLNLWILQRVYFVFSKKNKVADLLGAPIFLWLMLNFVIANALEGASFFILPVFAALFVLALAVFTNLEMRVTRIIATIFSIPTIYIFAPFLKMFPVGLGLKMTLITSLFLVLTFSLLVFTFYQKKLKWPMRLTGIFAILFFGYSTYLSSDSEENKTPNSLVYVQNETNKKAYFGTYNSVLDDFTKQVFKETKEAGDLRDADTKSKYNTRFAYQKETAYKSILSSEVTIDLDTLINDKRFVDLTITPKRKVNKLEFTTKIPLTLSQLKVNDALVNNGKDYSRKRGSFLIYHMGNSDKEVSVSFSVSKEQKLDFILNEISYDLLTSPSFNLSPRASSMIPMPFVTNDAIIINKQIKL